jgi:hypothetical protein
VQEQEQVKMGQALLLILQLITMSHVCPKDMMVPEIVDQSVNLQLKYPVDNIWSVKSCQAMAIPLHNIPHFPPGGVSNNSD